LQQTNQAEINIESCILFKIKKAKIEQAVKMLQKESVF
jgi:hypothetical protein